MKGPNPVPPPAGRRWSWRSVAILALAPILLAALGRCFDGLRVWAADRPAAAPPASPPPAAGGPLAVSPAVAQAEQQRIAAIAKATKPSLCIFDPAGQGGGSGVVISADGFALTNFHVVQPCGTHMKCGMSDGKLYDAVIVGLDPTGDVAMVKLHGRSDFPVAEIADSDTVRVGDWCFAIGNPFLLATDLQPTVSFGIVSGTHRYQYPAGTLLEYADCLQTDAAINPGNSGGPLFNAAGQLIGINGRGSFEKRGRVNVGVGYAISINQIQKFAGYLRSGRVVDHATLGASVSTDDEGKVVVSNILESSDAYRRGLRYGDEIVAFGGRQIATVNAFKNVLGIFPKGWRAPLSYRRKGERFDVLVRLSGVHRSEELASLASKAPPKRPDPKPGEKPKAPPKPGEEPAPGKDPPPGHPLMKASPMPEELKKVYEARSGYANFYFNKLNRDRVWQAFSNKSKTLDLAGPWSLEGQLTGGGEVKIGWKEKQLAGVIGNDSGVLELEKELDKQLFPAGSGGLLTALAVWQRLLTVGPAKYGEVYYLGTAPVPEHDQLADVLVATYGATETWFYFDPTGGDLWGMEMFPESDVDPCEIRFSNYEDVGGRRLPMRLDVLHGGGAYGSIQVRKWVLPDGKEKPKS